MSETASAKAKSETKMRTIKSHVTETFAEYDRIARTCGTCQRTRLYRFRV